MKLLDKQYYDNHYIQYMKYMVEILIKVTYSYGFSSWEKDGVKYISVEGGILEKKDRVRFVFNNTMNGIIELDDFDFDSLYNSKDLVKERYIVNKIKQIMLNHKPTERIGNSLFYLKFPRRLPPL